MSLLLGTLDPELRPAAIVAYYPAIGFHPVAPPPPPTDPARPPIVPPLDLDELGRVPSWMLFPPGTAQSEPDAASSVSLLHKDFPPTILVHGAGDRLFAARSNVALHQKLLEPGGSTELHIYSDRDHQFDMAPSMARTAAAATTSFVERLVTQREESDAEARKFGFPSARP